MGKLKLYYYSTDTLKFVEAKWAKTKLTALTLVVGAVLVTAVVEINQYMDDAMGLGFGRASALAAENAILRDQLRVLSFRLPIQGNEFRVLVDLPQIDEDTRRAGAGGRS